MAFLRIKKPQPAYLTRIIRERKVRLQKRVDIWNEIKDYWIPLSQAEDRWESEISKLCQRKGGSATNSYLKDMQSEMKPGMRFSYSETGHVMAAHISALRKAELDKRFRWAQKLWKIAMQERQLKFEEEGVLVPLLGPFKDRLQIMKHQRRERRSRIAERLRREQNLRLEEAALRNRRTAQEGVSKLQSKDDGYRHDNPAKEPFVVQLK